MTSCTEKGVSDAIPLLFPFLFQIRKRATDQRTWTSNLDSAKGPGPYKLKFVGGGKCAIVNRDGSIIWSRGQNAASIELTDDGVLKIFSAYDSAESRNLLWDSEGVAERNQGSSEDRAAARDTQRAVRIFSLPSLK